MGRVLAMLWCLAAWGSPPAAAGGGDPGAVTLRASIHADLPEYSFTLGGEADGGIFMARSIEIRRDGAVEPVQILDGLETETPVSADDPGLEVLDMNFDGYGDLRIVAFRPAGPNVPYLNWLFDPASARFVRSSELDAITSPVFDSQTRLITSSWRGSAASYGTDTYAVVDGKPMLVRKEQREYTEEGVYHLTVSELVDGAWQTLEDKVVRETGAPTQSWQCRNGDVEVQCADERCEAETGEGFTPMSVSFDDSGAMSVCAYSGCWEGHGEVFRSGGFLVLIGHDLEFSTSRESESSAADILIALDRVDGVATLKAGAFAQPLLCKNLGIPSGIP